MRNKILAVLPGGNLRLLLYENSRYRVASIPPAMAVRQSLAKVRCGATSSPQTWVEIVLLWFRSLHVSPPSLLPSARHSQSLQKIRGIRGPRTAKTILFASVESLLVNDGYCLGPSFAGAALSTRLTLPPLTKAYASNQIWARNTHATHSRLRQRGRQFGRLAHVRLTKPGHPAGSQADRNLAS